MSEQKPIQEIVDWSVFEGPVTTTCRCRCGEEYRSHAKVLFDKGGQPVSKNPCPGCGSYTNIRGIEGDPEKEQNTP